MLAGACKDVAAFVRRHKVNAIYMLAVDLVQPRCVELNGMPLLSICGLCGETANLE